MDGQSVTAPRPGAVEDEHLIYLDALRDSGATNMFGATPYLVEEFGVTKRAAREILMYWMRTFDERHGQGGATRAE